MQSGAQFSQPRELPHQGRVPSPFSHLAFFVQGASQHAPCCSTVCEDGRLEALLEAPRVLDTANRVRIRDSDTKARLLRHEGHRCCRGHSCAVAAESVHEVETVGYLGPQVVCCG